MRYYIRNIIIHVDRSKGRAQPWSDCHHCNVAIYWARTVGRHSAKGAARGRRRSETGRRTDLSSRGCSAPAVPLVSRQAHSQGLQNEWEGRGRFL